MPQAIGMIENVGFLGTIAATDAALKAANVNLLASEKVKGGLTTVILTGDVAAVNAAVDAGVSLAKLLKCYHSHHVIARTDRQIDQLFQIKEKEIENPTVETESEEVLNPETLSDKTLEELREIATNRKNIELSDEQIKFATKARLIKALLSSLEEGGES